MTKEILYAGIIQAVSFSGHTLRYVVCLKQLVILVRCVLEPLITVKKGAGHISFFIGELDGIKNQFKIVPLPDSVGNNFVVKHVIDGRQKQPLSIEKQVGDICRPFFIWPRGLEISVQ